VRRGRARPRSGDALVAGFNRDPAGAKENLRQLNEAFARAGRTRPASFEIIITPPMSMPMDVMPAYGELGVHRLVLNLGSQRPERVDKRLPEIERLVKRAA
jgi:hypothetical protein